MTVRTTIQVHFDAGDVSHRHKPTYSTLDLEGNRVSAYLFFSGPDLVDEVIAELTALRAEMTAGPAALDDSTWKPLADGACGHGADDDGEGIACGVILGADGRHAGRHEREAATGCGGGTAHWPNEDEAEPVGDALAERAALAASIASGVPLAVYDDDPRCGCGHQQTLHDEDRIPSPCRAVACGCTRFSDAASAAS
jgi:hypothetical protein